MPPAYTTDALRGLRSSYYQVLIAQAKIVCRCTSKDDHILAANVGPGGGSEGKNAKTRTSSAYGTRTSTGWNFFFIEWDFEQGYFTIITGVNISIFSLEGVHKFSCKNIHLK